jgi:hypothetical protein
MTAGYSRTALPRKLGIAEGSRVGVLRGPGHLGELLRPLPVDVTLRAFRRSGLPYDVILLFASTRRVLDTLLPRAVPTLDWAGGLWIAWPKKRSALAADLREADVRAAGLATGLVDNKICAIDADWSGLRFVHRVENRPAP